MKKTQWIELLQNIKHSLVSFLAIVLFIALATLWYTASNWTISALSSSVEADYERGHFHHYELSFLPGFDQEFMDLLIEDGIADEAEGHYEVYNFLRHRDDRFQVRLISLMENIDRPYCYEGELPTQEGEIALKHSWAEENGFKVGDEISFENSENLTTDSFVVTALVNSAEYMGSSPDLNGVSPICPAPIETVMFVAEQSIKPGMTFGYPEVSVRINELEKYESLTDEYRELSEQLLKDVEDYADAYAAQDRFELMSCQAYVSSRLENPSYVGVRNATDTFVKIRYSIVGLFVIIALLVCYSTVSRIIYDQAVLIGTKKAIGFFKRDIVKPFLFYSGIGVVAGAGLGALLGRFLMEVLMVDSVRDIYGFDGTVYYFEPSEVLIFALFQLVLLLFTSFFASINVSKRSPLKLLTGEIDNSGQRFEWLNRIPFWNRISLMKRTIIRNCLTDPRRVVATVIGVMGCAALVVSSLSMYNNVAESFEINMDRISKYDTSVYYSGNEETQKRLHSLLDANGIEYADVNYSYGTMRSEDGDQLFTGMYVTDNSDLYRFLCLYDMEDGTEKQAEHDVWVNNAYAKNFDGNVGDTLKYTDANGSKHDLFIEGIYEYYLMNYQLILPVELYEREFGEKYKPNVLIVNASESEFEKLKTTILNMEDGLIIADSYADSKLLYESVLGLVRTLVMVYLFLSVILAALVLLNLFTMFVNEKKKELIILRINGFSLKDAERYIHFDTVFLTIIGIAVGIALGIIMGKVSVESFNNSATCFMNLVNLKACVIGAVFTAIMTLIMCRIAIRKIKHFPLA